VRCGYVRGFRRGRGRAEGGEMDAGTLLALSIAALAVVIALVAWCISTPEG